MLPPQYIKAAQVHNQTTHSVQVTVTFGSAKQQAEGNDFVTQELAISPNDSVLFDEKTYEMGSWQAVAPVHSIQVSKIGDTTPSTSSVLYETNPESLIGKQTFHIVEGSNGLLEIELGKAN